MKKKLIYILILLTISATVKVVAETLIEGKYVSYDNTRSNTNYNTVQASVEDLYDKLKEKECIPQNVACPANKDCVKKIGQLITINNENFYVIKSSQYETVLIAQNVLSQTTGKQEATGLEIEFSSTNYWYDTALDPKYGSGYNAYVYDSNSNIKTYLESYKTNILNTNSDIVKHIRLMSYEEATEIGCTTTANSCDDWITGNQTYWLGSAESDIKMWYVDSNIKKLEKSTITDQEKFNIKPVIVVKTTDI